MKIEMNGIEYEIREVMQKEYKEYKKEEDKELGCKEIDMTTGIYYRSTHTYKNIIFIDKELPLDRKRKTLIHELTHCYINEYITHEDKNYSEEDVCDIASNSFDIIMNIVNNYFNLSY